MLLEHFKKLLKTLGENTGHPDLTPHQEGICSLRFDDRLIIDLECSEEKETLLLSSLVGVLKPDQRKKFYSELLEANLLWGGTGGATLGIDPETLTVFLCHQERMREMSFSRFQELIRDFSDTALFWNDRLSSEPSQKEEAGSFSL